MLVKVLYFASGLKHDDTPDVSAHSTPGETFSDDLGKGDHTTVAVLSSKQLQRTRWVHLEL